MFILIQSPNDDPHFIIKHFSESLMRSEIWSLYELYCRLFIDVLLSIKVQRIHLCKSIYSYWKYLLFLDDFSDALMTQLQLAVLRWLNYTLL